jgi:hypothetical protein
MASGDVLEVIVGPCLELEVVEPHDPQTGRLARYWLLFS